jgi:phosphoribosylformylglycinamidine synthase
MLEGPIGAASYNNEFGRPALCGYFRTYEQADADEVVRGYHKPIMLAGGYGMIRSSHACKNEIPAGAKIIVLGGPAMLIGLGGGAASSMASGESDESLDFASVQRGNAEIQRRCQEVIDRCWAMAENNPIVSIHDVGAGGLSNALPELVSDSDRGARFELRNIPNDEPGMSPMEVWCNESQERYVLAIKPEETDVFESLCKRERAPYAILGEATHDEQLILDDAHFNNRPIDMPMSILLGKMPHTSRNALHTHTGPVPFDSNSIELDQAVERILRLPTVADKRFLITIGDRTVSGLVVRDQMVGPWQVPVADCAVTVSSYDAYVGEAMAIGERTPIALLDAPASGRMAVGEAITNIITARIINLDDIALSANWMAACGDQDEDARLFDTVQAVSQLCIELGIAIPVGKDSLSMNTVWHDDENQKQVTSPLSLNITAFARVADIRLSLTPQLLTDETDTELILIDLGCGKNRLGGSALTQVYNQVAGTAPDLDDAALLKGLFRSVQLLNEMGLVLAYHDRSDGGLFVTLCEMAFAGHTGLAINLEEDDVIAALFNEELGAVIQIRREDSQSVLNTLCKSGLDQAQVHVIGSLNEDMQLRIAHRGNVIFSEDILTLHRLWSGTTYHMQSMRDNPVCAQQEYDRILDRDDHGLFVNTSFDINNGQLTNMINRGVRPSVAILREQGVNGQVEMAAAFDRAGFNCIDVHMSDIINGQISLDDFRGMAICGGFSYGDVLGAGGGWAKSILFNNRVRETFQAFFQRQDTFTLGVCNGCQMLSQLRTLVPGAEHWPDFVRNTSEQFEARLVMVEVTESPSILFDGMEGSQLPVVVAHGEGRVDYDQRKDAIQNANIVLRFVDNNGDITETYPANPNGSAGGITGLTTSDGRITIMMPHPERVFLKKQFSWFPPDWPHEDSPWMRLFINARKWVN